MNVLSGSTIVRQPRADGGDWISAMRAGEFERAWAITDRDLAACRWGTGDKHSGPRHLQRIWRGEELRNRKVLVRCYHGLGDTIQFARFLPPLAERARMVTVWCQSELVPLIERLEGVDRAIPLHDGTPDADFAVDIEIMEIPHALKASRDLFELRMPYLSLPPGRLPKCVRKQEKLAVGLVWEVGDWDKRRAIPPQLLKRLNREGIELFSLQRAVAPGVAAQIGAKDISTPDIIELGRRIGELDIVVSVDTMIVHLAGALGHEPWVLLHADCDWRWPNEGEASIWYPRAKLFYQRDAGDWASVIETVSLALADRIATTRPPVLGAIPDIASGAAAYRE
ncbi:hypothetical protein [Bradyrhizobium archetypum]|uniref:hypothetical protein n=1 Tax=Bradyrhizobium archetypum TaxID=2721160 RepID=UPI001AEDD8BF|nr:hypothetical protein [Bradyrhizobium archetypum]